MRDSSQFGDSRPSATRNPITVGKEDADDRHQQCVEQTDEETRGYKCRIRNKGFRLWLTSKTRRIVQKTRKPDVIRLRLQGWARALATIS